MDIGFVSVCGLDVLAPNCPDKSNGRECVGKDIVIDALTSIGICGRQCVHAVVVDRSSLFIVFYPKCSILSPRSTMATRLDCVQWTHRTGWWWTADVEWIFRRHRYHLLSTFELPAEERFDVRWETTIWKHLLGNNIIFLLIF